MTEQETACVGTAAKTDREMDATTQAEEGFIISQPTVYGTPDVPIKALN